MSCFNYLKKIEEENGVYSVMYYQTINNPIPDFDDRLEFVWGESSYTNNKVIWFEKIYKTKQNFYIKITNISTSVDFWNFSIYYKPEQYNELIVFIKSLNKELNNARSNNTGT